MIQTIRHRHEGIRRVLVVTLILNWIVAGVKIWAGHSYHFLSLSSSGLESVFDGASNILALIAITFSSMPSDRGHNFGHHKHETLGSLIISLLLFGSAIQLGFEYKELIFEKNTVTGKFGIVPLLCICVSMLMSAFVSWYEKKKGEEFKSSILLADADHTRGDMIMSLGVLFSIICTSFGWYWPDIAVGILLIIYLIYLGVKIAKQNLGDLLDAAPEIEKEVLEELETLPYVRNIHRFRVRGNENWMQIDFHVLLDPELSLVEAHRAGHAVEDHLREVLLKSVNQVDITVHIEPFEPNHRDG